MGRSELPSMTPHLPPPASARPFDSAPPFTNRSAPRHIPVFDALRGYAILAVLVVHTRIALRQAIPAKLSMVLGFGEHGVQLFYLVSACTLFWSLANRTSADRAPIRAFFTRRLFRIAPMFYLAIITGLLIDGLA